jgi:hypothetical protein
MGFQEATVTVGMHVGAVLLPVVTGLLLEELTFGGLVRLLLAPWPGDRKEQEHTNRKRARKCSH